MKKQFEIDLSARDMDETNRIGLWRRTLTHEQVPDGSIVHLLVSTGQVPPYVIDGLVVMRELDTDGGIVGLQVGAKAVRKVSFAHIFHLCVFTPLQYVQWVNSQFNNVSGLEL